MNSSDEWAPVVFYSVENAPQRNRENANISQLLEKTIRRWGEPSANRKNRGKKATLGLWKIIRRFYSIFAKLNVNYMTGSTPIYTKAQENRLCLMTAYTSRVTSAVIDESSKMWLFKRVSIIKRFFQRRHYVTERKYIRSTICSVHKMTRR